MIGRGLRLPVNQEGERVHDESVNRLTVVANESFKTFAAGLQQDYKTDLGIEFGKVSRVAFSRILVQGPEGGQPLGQDASATLWRHLQSSGYLDADGGVLPRYDPKNPHFTLSVPPGLEELRAPIIDAIDGFLLPGRIVDARDKQKIRRNKQLTVDPEFERLWSRIAQRTRYRVAFDSAALTADAAKRLRDSKAIAAPRITIEKADITPTLAGVQTRETRQRYEDVAADWQIPDILGALQNQTELTRGTIARILIDSGRIEQAKINPQQFINQAAQSIHGALGDVLVDGIQYHPVPGSRWEMGLLEGEEGVEVRGYLDRLYQVQNKEKTVADFVPLDSQVERDFVTALDDDDDVTFFVKLPSSFTVDTPVGTYNPDWAVLYSGREPKLYLVRETKGSTDKDDLRARENRKIACARQHFAAIGVDYDVTSSWRETVRTLAR